MSFEEALSLAVVSVAVLVVSLIAIGISNAVGKGIAKTTDHRDEP